jgi:ubiquinone/menaquinone biosynthesis C-methylase UbiE
MSHEGPIDYEPGVQRVLNTRQETKAYYNKIAKVYDLLAEKSERAMRELGQEKLAARKGERILEIGFGTGHTLVALAKAVGPQGRVLGIDISEQMAELARDLVRKEDVADRVELVVGDAARLPCDDQSLDGIITSFTLELFDTPEIPKVLEECKRALKPGGRLVVVSLSKEGKQGVVMRVYEWTHRHFPNLLDCRPIYVARALEAAGFEIEDKTIGHMWVPVEVVRAVRPG